MLTLGGAYQSWESLGWRAKIAKFMHLIKKKKKKKGKIIKVVVFLLADKRTF
jgi:hypothetical protein